MDNVAGGKAFTRFSQTVLLLKTIDKKRKNIVSDQGTYAEDVNRELHLWKANNGRATKGCRIAFWFDSKSLTLKELGIEERD